MTPGGLMRPIKPLNDPSFEPVCQKMKLIPGVNPTKCSLPKTETFSIFHH